MLSTNLGMNCQLMFTSTDFACSVACFPQFHGGTNFGNTAGRFVATSYDYDAPLDEYGKIISKQNILV